MKYSYSLFLCIIVIGCNLTNNKLENQNVYDTFTEDRFLILSNIRNLYDETLIDSLNENSLNVLNPLECKDLVQAQAGVWNNNASLFGVSSPVYRYQVIDDTLYVDPIVWLYLYKNDTANEILAISVIKDSIPKILSVGRDTLNSFDEWLELDAEWLYELDQFGAGIHQQLVCYELDSEIIPVWISEPTIGIFTEIVLTNGESYAGCMTFLNSFYLTNRYAINSSHVIMVNANTGNRIQDERSINTIITQRNVMVRNLSGYTNDTYTNAEEVLLVEGTNFIRRYDPFYFGYRATD